MNGMATIIRERLREHRVAGLPLGRHVNHDSRSLAYQVARTAQATTHWQRLISILNQGDVGSCTGNAETGALGSQGLYESVQQVLGGTPLDETFAVDLYSDAETLDGDGPYPPNDNGSSGLSVSKAAKNRGLISGYVHALSVDDMINGLQQNAGITGINWYSSFDTPDANGVLSLPATATVRGGHELHLLNVDMEREVFELPNSWGTSWGVAGVCFMPFTVMERLLKEDGDATFPVPATSPAPTPTPVPSPDTSAYPGSTPAIDAHVATAAGHAALSETAWLNHHLDRYFKIPE